MTGSRRFAVEYDPEAVKELKKLDKPIARRIARTITQLADDPRPRGARPLKGFPELWRLRVGDYQVIYTIRDAELLVLALRVAHRSTVYRDL